MRKCHSRTWPCKGSSVAQSQPSLPTDQAFVIQFRAPTAGASPRYEGRIEHLASYQVARFQSLEELLAFMIRVLTDVQHRSD